MELDSVASDGKEVGREDSSSNDSSSSRTSYPSDLNDPRKACLSCCTGIRALVPAVITACIMSLLGGTTLSYSSSTLLELKDLPDPRLRFDTTLLSDIFGVRKFFFM